MDKNQELMILAAQALIDWNKSEDTDRYLDLIDQLQEAAANKESSTQDSGS